MVLEKLDIHMQKNEDKALSLYNKDNSNDQQLNWSYSNKTREMLQDIELCKGFLKYDFKNISNSWVPVAHAYNPRYMWGWDWEDHGLRLAQANSSWDSIYKTTKAKWTRGVE
jgi:hypothetical protein